MNLEAVKDLLDALVKEFTKSALEATDLDTRRRFLLAASHLNDAIAALDGFDSSFGGD